MEKMIAYCGIVCTECPAYIATQKDDDNEREKVAQEWSKEEFKVSPADINCDGCLQDEGKLFNWCMECSVRKCSRERGFQNCAYCDDYVCEKLKKIFDMAPEARNTLEGIRKNL